MMAGLQRRLRLGMVGGGRDAFIGAVHRIAARLDDRWELVAGALASEPERARASAADLRLAPDRGYDSFAAMAQAEAAREDGIDAVAIVTPNNVHHPAARAFLEAGIHVICDKPLTATLAEAEDLAALARERKLIFGVTYNYTGYPMVRQAREMVAGGLLGQIRVVQVEYPQDWLSTPLEASGNKQAAWRTDPARSGPAGCLGDIGSHAANLTAFVSGLRCEAVAADLSRCVAGRQVADNGKLLRLFAGGARGMLWASQVAPGNENGLRLRIYGTEAGLDWAQEHPNQLRHTRLGEVSQTLSRGGPGLGPAAGRATRIPNGHPEGYLEAFAQLYTDLAEQVAARLENRPPDPAALLVPTVEDGLQGMRFTAAVLASADAGSAWTPV
ncbi:MAG: Gfo/Idh/MocA family oxidoreductase [Sneathiellaceae bacterium]